MKRWLCPLLLMAACGVPDLRIVEREGVLAEPDAGAVPADSETESLDAGATLPNPRPDAGPSQQTGRQPRAGSAASSGGRGGMAAGAAGASGAGQAGAAGEAPPPQTAAGAAGAPAPNEPDPPPAKVCAVWLTVDISDPLPEGAIEGGFETLAGATTRQYVCRIRPEGNRYAIPGKYVPGVGCYIVHVSGGELMDASVVGNGPVEALTAAPGCVFSWRSASPTQLPQGAVDLGDPAGGAKYACRGDNTTFGANAKHVGTIIPSADDPPQNQCFFELFTNTVQPSEPAVFEVLVQD